jgi:hypothetical protein
VAVVRIWGEDIDAAVDRQAQMMKELAIDGFDQLSEDKRRATFDGLLENIDDHFEALRQSGNDERPDQA